MPDTKTYYIQLKPIGVDLTVPAGTPLRDVLFDQGAEFPCGGQGRCRPERCPRAAGAERTTQGWADDEAAAESVLFAVATRAASEHSRTIVTSTSAPVSANTPTPTHSAIRPVMPSIGR